MQNPTAMPSPPWREIATQITLEQDPQKMAVLLAELNRPLDEQVLKKAKPLYGKSKPDLKTRVGGRQKSTEVCPVTNGHQC